MFKEIKVTHEQYHTLLTIQELLSSEVYFSSQHSIDDSMKIEKDIDDLIEEYQNNHKHEIE